MKETINYVFNNDVSQVVFGNTSALTTKNGKTIAERFITAVTPIIQKEMEAEIKASNKRTSKHLVKYQKPKLETEIDDQL